MTFEELGATLRAEREKRGLSIEDVANELKINPRQLRALEDGDAASLPHPAYVRGFIRSYAGWLGLGSDEIHKALETLTYEKKPAKAPAPAPQEIFLPENEPEPRKSGGKGLLIFLLLCAIGGGAWYAWQAGAWEYLQNRFLTSQKLDEDLQSADKYMDAKDQSEAREAEKRKAEAESAKPEPAAEKVLPMPGNDNQTVLAPIAPGSNPAERAAAGIEAAKNQEAAIAEKAAPSNAEEQDPAEQAENAANAEGPHKLVITATEECWVHSNADKTDTRQFSLRKGDTFALAFSKSLELKLGNAGGVRLRYDGRDLPPPGTSGQVRTLVFPAAGNQ